EIVSTAGPRRVVQELPRASRQLETTVVDGHLFSFLPSLEGKWSGEATSLSGQSTASSVKIAYRPPFQRREVRTTSADSSGLSDVQTTLLEPISHGRCRAVHDRAPLPLQYEEQCGDLFATLTQRCVLTGGLEKLEVWSLQTSTSASEAEQRLTRTVSLYKDSDGSLTSMVVSRERKVA
ncbi:unnamed protein product, partial [Prorocentrum cordatum]